MRLWSIHPKYLDSKGLVAVWREGLLARAVLKGRTRGYRNHPQLERFRRTADPVRAVERYLHFVWLEARSRGYHFDARKRGPALQCRRIPVAEGQLRYELRHLERKLRVRNPTKYREVRGTRMPEPHPLFRRVPGAREDWEKPA